MSIKKAAAFIALAVLAPAAFAQKAPAPGTNITVSKTGAAMYSTVQAAVNAAAPGQVIEILDESVYEEQVVFDGRENHPWKGNNAVRNKTGGVVNIAGGKKNITLRYVATAANGDRPVIMWRDTVNRSPKTAMEAQIPGDTLGSSGNFETCGAVRVIRTTGITIEGIIIDGGGSRPWSYAGVWGMFPLTHGNAAVAIVISGNVQIRDCEARNAYFGIYAKDRNLGGVFGNPGPNDNDVTIPLSGFGETGNHLFEFNKVHNNNVGVDFEASWDRGSTVRYNLIYRNHNRSSTPAQVFNSGISTTSYVDESDYADGGIKFKDAYLSPVAIYNNTLFENRANILGGWQAGGQHLVFNNIFGRLRDSTGAVHIQSTFRSIEDKFPIRMFNCLFSGEEISVQTIFVGECNNQPSATPPFISGQSIPGVYQVRISNGFPTPERGPTTVGCLAPIENMTVTTNQFVPPGALIAGTGGGLSITYPAAANLRWLETAGGTFKYGSSATGPTVDMPMLFKSVTPGEPGFLEPDWSHPLVTSFIEKKGWPAVGIRREDGELADLGAIQRVGKKPGDNQKQFSRTRVSPFEVVFIEPVSGGLKATASIKVDQEAGALSNLKVKYLAWIGPIPDNTDKSGNQAIPIPTSSIKVLSVTDAVDRATQTIVFNIPGTTVIPEYGFFEIALEGTDGMGRTVNTDVGFLPYRELDYKLQFTVTSPTTVTSDGRPSVKVGEPVTIRVKAVRKDGTDFTSTVNGPLNVQYGLSDGASYMWRGVNPQRDSLVRGNIRAGGSTGAFETSYTVYFTKAGDEVVSGSGIFNMSTTQMLVFRGTLQLLVAPSAPARILFLNPISKKYLPAGVPPPSISAYYPVKVQVQDELGNPSYTQATVALRALTPGVASIVPSSAQTDAATGTAEFAVLLTGGAAGDIFDLEALMIHNSVIRTDTASLMVSAPLTPDSPPKITAGGYVSSGGVIKSASLTFDRAASRDWFSSVVFTFGIMKGTLTNMGCLAVDPTDGKQVSVDFECAFPGTGIPSALGDNSEITINFSGAYDWAPLTVTIVNGAVSVLTPNRVIPPPPKTEEASVIAPAAVILAGGFTAGPNPVDKNVGTINFFRQGRRVANCELRIYDAAGNVINKIKIADNKTLNSQARRKVGAWDLKDKKGRTVPEGTYLVKGVLKTSDGKSEKVSVIIGVR